MKIYFTASLSGKTKYKENYQTIVQTVEKLGHKLLAKNVLVRNPQDVLKETAEDASRYYNQMVRWIKEADIVIAEASYPSTGIGYEVSLALNNGKPVIVLYTKGREPYLLESTQIEKLQLVEYQLGELSKMLEQAVEDAKDQMDVRFNFFISPKIGTYFDWIAKKKKVPRAVYLRRLIEEDMKKNKEYKG